MTSKKKVTGEEVVYLADLTSTRRMQHAVEFEHEITQAIQVHKGLRLEDVAAALINGDFVMLSDWELSGQLSFLLPEDEGLSVMAIRVEPFYVYQLTGDRYDDNEQDKIDYLNDFIKDL